MPQVVELVRRLDALWLPGVLIAIVVLLLILFEVAVLLGVLLGVAGNRDVGAVARGVVRDRPSVEGGDRSVTTSS